jgi:hypothetical protein
MSQRFKPPFFTPVDGNGNTYAGAKLYFYETGTSTPLDTYSDEALSVANANPVVADSNGLFSDIFLKGQSYKAILKTSADVTVWTADPVIGGLNIVDDTSPQAGGDVDMNGYDIQFDDATGIRDDSDNEQLIFQKTASAVNELTVTNAATGNGPELSATGGDTNIDLLLTPKGTGAINLQDKTLKRANLKDTAEITNALGDTGGGTVDIDLVDGNSVSLEISTATTTFTYSNPTASDELCGFVCVMTNGGDQTINYPAGQDWVGGTPPTWTAAGVDVWVNVTQDGGTTWLGFVVGLDVK